MTTPREPIGRPGARRSTHDLEIDESRTTPQELLEVNRRKLERVDECVHALRTDYALPALEEALMARMTRALNASERMIHKLSLHESVAEAEHALAVRDYMATVGRVEQLINGIDSNKEAGSKRPVDVFKEEVDEDAQIELIKINERGGFTVPQWILDYCAESVSEPSVMQYMLDPNEEADDLDLIYEQTVTEPNAADRRHDFWNIQNGMLFRAVKALAEDSTDSEGNRHRLMNIWQALEGEWKERYPAVANRYHQFQQNADQILQVLSEYYYPPKAPLPGRRGPGAMEAKEAPVEKGAPPDAVFERMSRELLRAQEMMAAIASERPARETALISELQRSLETVATDVELFRNVAKDEDDVERAEVDYMVVLFRAEELINKIDEQKASGKKTPITLEWSNQHDDAQYIDRLDEIMNDEGIDVPLWINNFLAHEILPQSEIREYMFESYDEDDEAQFDEMYEEALEKSGVERRTALTELSYRFMMRAAKLYMDDKQDTSGDRHQAALIFHHLEDDWKNRFAPVAAKYARLRAHIDEIAHLLSEEYHGDVFVSPEDL